MFRTGIILAGGVQSDGSLSAHVQDRLDAFISISDEFEKVIFSSRYTLNKPQRFNNKGFVVYEAAVMSEYFRARSQFPLSDQYLELASTDTIGSALYCRSLMENVGILNGEVKIVTSDWHYERSKEIFQWAFSLKNSRSNSSVIVNGVSVVDKDTPTDRVTKEKKALEQFRFEWLGVKCLSAAWNKLYQRHDNYNFKCASENVNYDKMRY